MYIIFMTTFFFDKFRLVSYGLCPPGIKGPVDSSSLSPTAPISIPGRWEMTFRPSTQKSLEIVVILVGRRHSTGDVQNFPGGTFPFLGQVDFASCSV